MEPLFGQIKACRKCTLRNEASAPVLPVGPAKAELVIVGRNPGTTEDIKGTPFVGPSGEMLDRMLHVAGIDRSTVWVTNLCKCKSQANRKPTEAEIRACTQYLRREILTHEPKLVIGLGEDVCVSILGVAFENSSIRPWKYANNRVSTFVASVHHPYHIIRSQSELPKYEQLWINLGKFYKELIRQVPVDDNGFI